MKMKLRNIFVAAMAMVAFGAMAEGRCEIAIGFAPFTTEGDKVPAGIERKLQSKIKTCLTANGVAAADVDCQFFVTGRFDHGYSERQSGMGGRVLVKTELQLAICDADGKKVYATETFPLSGMGASDEAALTKALTSLSPRNPDFINFVERGKEKIVQYFNGNYQTYLTKAKQALKARDYDQALYWSTQVPECCNGYDEASALSISIYNDRTNYESAMNLAKAEGEWAADPTGTGAAAAYQYLALVDPSASCYPQAKALGKKISQTVKDNYDFETKEKYRVEKALERRRIDAAKEVGVAWAQNQPKTKYYYNYSWHRW